MAHLLNKNSIAWMLFFGTVLVWSAINPKEYYTWILEVFPALIAVSVLGFTYKNFKLTPLSYFLILLHSCILFIGGHYTYAEVPLFNWVRDFFHQSRNNYDKIGHFAQGFIPAIVTRELFIRLNVIIRRGWLFFIVVCVCLAISALYELIEWATAVMSGSAAEAFLGTQGYVWDTQSDMLMALIGAIFSLSLLGKLHDRQIEFLIHPR